MASITQSTFKRHSWSWMWQPIAVGIGAVLIVIAVDAAVRFLPNRVFACDFSLAYLPGRLLHEGRDIYTASLEDYNTTLGRPFVEKMGPTTNPPLLMWFFSLLAWLRPAPAFWVWTAIEAASVVIIFATCYRLLGARLSRGAWLLAVGLAVCSMPMFSHFWFAQIQLPVTAIAMIGIYAWQRGRGAIATVPITLAAVLKIYPWPLVLLPALGSAGKPRIGRLLLLAVLMVAWAIVPGWALWQSFFRNAAPFLGELATGGYYNFTITSLIAALAGARIAVACGGAISLGVIALAYYRCDAALRVSEAAREASACLLLVSVVMCSAIAWTHYFVVLIYPLVCLAAHAREERGTRRYWAAGLLGASLLAFNMAGSNPLSGAFRPIKILGAYLPLFVMGGLYVYFNSRLGLGKKT